MKIKAARLYDSMDMRIETFELPEPAAGEVLLRPIASGLDLSDNQAFRVCSSHIRVPVSTPSDPVITGHELCGEVAEVGEGLESSFSPGDKVVLFRASAERRERRWASRSADAAETHSMQ